MSCRDVKGNGSPHPFGITLCEEYNLPPKKPLYIIFIFRFEYRGFMLDVSRNFHNKQSVIEILDVMSWYKLNVFHFHLTDDEGWRIQIPGLPELTEVRESNTLD